MRLLVALTVIVALLMSLTSVNAQTTSPDTPFPSVKSMLASKTLLLDITLIGNKSLVAVGQYGHIILSPDGKSWLQAKVPVQVTLTSVYFVNELLGWAVGHDATILHSSDGGKSWQIQQYLPALEKPLLDVFFKNDKQGIAVGSYGQFYRTDNGGQTWESEFHQELLMQDDIDYLNELKAEDELSYLDEISFILPHFNRIKNDGKSLYLLGEAGLLAKSDNFGLSWQAVDDFYLGSFYAMARTKSDNLLIVGLRGHVFKDQSNGGSWKTVTTNTTALLNDIVISNDDRIFILGNNGMLLSSQDDGQTFTADVQRDGKSLIAGVWFNDKLIAVSDVGIKILDVLRH